MFDRIERDPSLAVCGIVAAPFGNKSVRAFVDLGAERFFAMHWGTYKLTDEDLLEPPQVLREHWDVQGLPESRREIPAIGETVLLGRDRARV